MNFLKSMYEVWCTGLLASHLTRRGRWRSAVKLMENDMLLTFLFANLFTINSELGEEWDFTKITFNPKS